MNLKLHRVSREVDGVFGELLDDKDKHIAFTLEHSYDSGHGDGSYTSKIPNGSYNCVRGMHRLHSMKVPFETFEITGVKGHDNILFHVGNYNVDSEGCVLLGLNTAVVNKIKIITHSKLAFDKFMNLQNGVNSFNLIVT